MKDDDSGSFGPDEPRAGDAAPDARAWKLVDEGAAAELLADAERSRWLEPFLARTRSASEAADELGVELDAMLYRLRVLRKLGLVEIVAQTPRAGRPIKRYRSTADAFFVPYYATPYVELRDRLLDEGREHRVGAAGGLARAMRDQDDLGRRILRDSEGRIERSTGRIGDEGIFVEPSAVGAGPVLGDVIWDTVRLDDDDARAMLAEMLDLFARILAMRSTRGSVYRIGFTLVRDDEASPRLPDRS